jgi:hypothetical protein
MRKTIVGFTAAAALVATSFAPVPAAKADPISAWWLLPAFLGGMWFASAWQRPLYAAPRGAANGYYTYGSTYYAPAGTTYYAPAAPRGEMVQPAPRGAVVRSRG